VGIAYRYLHGAQCAPYPLYFALTPQALPIPQALGFTSFTPTYVNASSSPTVVRNET